MVVLHREDTVHGNTKLDTTGLHLKHTHTHTHTQCTEHSLLVITPKGHFTFSVYIENWLVQLYTNKRHWITVLHCLEMDTPDMLLLISNIYFSPQWAKTISPTKVCFHSLRAIFVHHILIREKCQYCVQSSQYSDNRDCSGQLVIVSCAVCYLECLFSALTKMYGHCMTPYYDYNLIGLRSNSAPQVYIYINMLYYRGKHTHTQKKKKNSLLS